MLKRGTWKDKTKHKRNDVVYWRGKSYRCIERYLKSFIYIFGINDQYIFIYALPPTIVKRSYRPDNQRWTLLLLSNDNIETCNIGDNMKEKWLKVVDKIYLCLKRTRYQNTWVEEHDVHQSDGN